MVTELRQQLGLWDNVWASGQDTRGSLSPLIRSASSFPLTPYAQLSPNPEEAPAQRSEQRETKRGSAPQCTNNAPSHSPLAHWQSSVPYTVLSFPPPFNLMQDWDQPPPMYRSHFPAISCLSYSHLLGREIRLTLNQLPRNSVFFR